MKKFSTFIAAAAALGVALALPSAAQAQDGDAKAGERIFKRCMACHRVGEGAKNVIGPQLNDLFGRQVGGLDDFKYSPVMPALGKVGVVWDRETFAGYLSDPRGWLVEKAKAVGLDCGKLKNCRNRMQFAGLRKESEINDVIAYLLTYDADGMPTATKAAAEQAKN